MSQPLRERARTAGRQAAQQNGAEPTIVFEVGQDPDEVPVKVAWARAMRFCRALSKGSTATVTTAKGSFSYKYRGIDDVVSLAGAAFREFGIIVMPKEIKADQRNSGNSSWCQVDVTFEISCLGEGTITGVSSGEAMDFGDKARVKALTQAFRVFLTTAMALPTYDVSLDSDAHSFTRNAPSPDELRDEMLNSGTTKDRLLAILGQLRRDPALAATKVRVALGADGQWIEESLLDLNMRIGQQRKGIGD